MKTTSLLLTLAAGSCLLLSSCRSHKNLTQHKVTAPTEKTVSQAENQNEQIVQRLNANRSKEQYLTAKLKFSATMGTKDISVGGSVKMKRDDVIQLSLVAFGIIEAGKLEFTKDYVLMIDRINKAYIKLPYNQVDFLAATHLDFNVLQSLFWNELFVPGKKTPAGSDFQATQPANQTVTLHYKDNALAYTFVASLANYLVHQVTIASASPHTTADNAKVTWNYGTYTNFNGHSYPGEIGIQVSGLKSPLRVSLKLSRINNDRDWETRVQVKSSYKQIALKDLLKQIGKLSGN